MTTLPRSAAALQPPLPAVLTWPAENIAYEPDLVPPLDLMGQEGITTLEEWYRWGEEWSLLLRALGGMTSDATVLEIGCGLGRIAFPLRYILLHGRYEGFEICRYKVDFLKRVFEPRHANFRFTWANVHNTYYNPAGHCPASRYVFPYDDASFDLIYAASVFTHMVPENTRRYFQQAARVLRPGGCCVFSVFLLDHYQRGRSRPLGFARPAFDFDHAYGGHGARMAIANPDNPEEMTAYRLDYLTELAALAGLTVEGAPAPGFWSGSAKVWISAQDVVVLRKPTT